MNPKRVCYYHTSTNWKHLSQHHLNQQNQLQLAFDLSLEHGFHNNMKLFRPPAATLRQLNAFHSLSYLHFLQQADENARPEAAKKFGIYHSCVQVEETFGLYRLIAGATIASAEKINSDQADIAINWSGKPSTLIMFDVFFA